MTEVMSKPLDIPGPSRAQVRPATLKLRSIAYLASIDLASILVGFATAIVAREAVFGKTEWTFSLLTTIPLYLIIAINSHAYDSSNLHHAFRAVRRGLRALAVAVAASVLVGFSLKASDSLPRLVTLFGFLLSGGLMFVGRYVFVRNYQAVIGGNPFKVILIHDHAEPPADDVPGVIVAAAADFDPESRDPVMYDRLAKALHSADRVVVACSPERRAAWAHALKGISVQGEIVVPELASLAPLAAAAYGSSPTMVVSTGPLGMIDRAIKRSFDLAVAGAMTLFLAPVLVGTAIAILIESGRPVLFRQTRIGRDNKLFEVLKFRSMRVERADGAGHRSTSRDDDRITRVGRFIRLTSIDELPQLLNVLQGSMSIVGPRPHALGSRAADKLFWEVDRRYWHRHAAKPGMTGLAQVRGFRGATVVEADLANRLQADLEYLEDWTIWRDIRILLLTVRVLRHQNAY